MSASLRASLRVAALLLAALATVYANVVFGGRSLVASENYNPMHPGASEDAYGPGFVPHGRFKGLHLYAGMYDPGAAWWIWEPAAEYLRNALERGEAPFWDPYVGAGQPAMANLNATHFFPPYLLAVLLGNGSLARNAYALGLLLAAGFFAWLLLRQHGLSEAGAAFGALVFMLSGALNQAIISLGGQTAACAPFALWLTRRLLERPSRGRIAQAALGYACVALSSCTPILVLTFGFVVAYAVTFALQEPPAHGVSRGGRLARFTLAAALSLGCVAWYYLPAGELIASSRHAGAIYAHAAAERFPAVTLLQLLSPDLLGGSAIYTGPPVRDPAPWRMHAIGVSALFAALLCGRGGPARRAALGLVAATVAALVAGKVVGLPPLQWLSGLPLLRNLHFAVYSSFLLHLLIALLAGIGADRAWRAELGTRRPLLAFAALGGALVALLVAALGLGLDGPWRPSLLNWIYRYTLLWVFAALAATAAVLLQRARTSPRERAFALGLLFVVPVAEGVQSLSFPRQRRFDVWRHPVAHVRALQALADGRRFVDYWALPANSNSAFGLFGLDSLMTFNADRLCVLYERYFQGGRQQFLRELRVLPDEPLLDRAGVGWLAVGVRHPDWLALAARRGYVQRHLDDHAAIYERTGGARYLVTPSYRVLTAPEVLERVAQAPSSELLLEERPGFEARPFDERASVRLLDFGLNAYALEVDSPGPALVYAAESHAPGWTASVNGRVARILRANYAFRAFEVPAGRSRVMLRYFPPGLRAGLLISAASVAATLALAAGALRRGARR